MEKGDREKKADYEERALMRRGLEEWEVAKKLCWPGAGPRCLLRERVWTGLLGERVKRSGCALEAGWKGRGSLMGVRWVPPSRSSRGSGVEAAEEQGLWCLYPESTGSHIKWVVGEC